jgi:excisionase family DNA binding protein
MIKGNDMETLLEVYQVAQRLSLCPSTVRKMVKKRILKAIRTGPALRTIRIYESSLEAHIKGLTED